RLTWLLIAGTVVIVTLAFQMDLRSAKLEEGTKVSPFAGFALNREVAYVVSTFGVSEPFFRRTILEQALFPYPETAILFLSNPVPRILWNDKPVDPSFGPYNFLRTGSTGYEAT